MASMNFKYQISHPSENCDCLKPLDRLPSDFSNESQIEPSKGRYNAGVLVGNWFYRRAPYNPPPDDWKTVYDTTYTCKRNCDLENDWLLQQKNKLKGDHGIGKDFLIQHHANDFQKNFTTTNDLYYRVIPAERCGPRRRKYSSRKNLWLPEIDLTKCFGNLTEFGLVEVETYKKCLAAIPSPRETMYASHFKKQKFKDEPDKYYPRPIGKMNEVNLDHLDINPNLPFRPHIIKI
ncbi:hypothetical protein TKK_0008876 [Trichogramma kaykai]|uniref:Uncharacterized protein n=1 Tax=Trichogramma kaykai TaxID=54128 RepID=A0ABD2X2K5_9HYME